MELRPLLPDRPGADGGRTLTGRPGRAPAIDAAGARPAAPLDPRFHPSFLATVLPARLDRPADGAARLGARPNGRRAAVLVPIVGVPSPFILLTRRSPSLRLHPGQVSCPGGRVDPADRDPVATALRETAEEIALDPGLVRVLGTLPLVDTSTGFAVLPVVGLLDPVSAWRAVPTEVDAIVRFEMAALLDPQLPRYEEVPGRETPHRVAVWPHPTERIWGATAAILALLAHRLRSPP